MQPRAYQLLTIDADLVTRHALQRPFGAKVYNVDRESAVDSYPTLVAGQALWRLRNIR
jgi:hypothetical protein